MVGERNRNGSQTEGEPDFRNHGASPENGNNSGKPLFDVSRESVVLPQDKCPPLPQLSRHLIPFCPSKIGG